MGAVKASFRFPLPADLRKKFKAEMRPLVGERAKKVGVARALRASRIADAKALCTAEVARAEYEYEQKRAQALASYEAKAAERQVVSKLATT